MTCFVSYFIEDLLSFLYESYKLSFFSFDTLVFIFTHRVCWLSCIIHGTIVTFQCGVIMYAGCPVSYRVLL